MRHNLNINGTIVSAESGETLVDAALSGRILIPHDCATGQCETCRVRIPWGIVDDAGTAYGDTVLACQARVGGDAAITFEEVPPTSTTKGKVEAIEELSPDVVELTVRTRQPLIYRPGQYGKLSLSGFPPREYSYSDPMASDRSPDQAVFQIRRLKNGKVSSALGKSVTVGHRATLAGPFGSAFLRHHDTGPLVLASSGTGFAPMWSLARAVKKAQTSRTLRIVTGVREPQDLYMMPALRWLRDHGTDQISITAEHGARGQILSGTADQHLPILTPDTIIHVAGNPQLVGRTKTAALAAEATCHADPFTPSAGKLGLADSLKQFASPSRLLRNLRG